jgi:O-antigen/teichoic acid export membrane protein
LANQDKSLIKRAGEGFLLNQVSKIFEFGLTFMFSIILARGMGAEKLGIYATVFTFCSLFTLASSFGFDEILNTFIPKERNNPGRISFLTRRLILYRFGLLLVSAAAIYLLADPIGVIFSPDAAQKSDLGRYLRLTVIFIVTGNLAGPFAAFFIGLLRMRVVALVRLISSAINVFLAYIVLVQYKQAVFANPMLLPPNEIGMTIGILTLSSIIALFIYVPIALPRLLVKAEKFALRPLFSFGITLWLINFINYILSKQSDIMVLTLNRVGGAEIGFYHTAYNLSQSINTLLLAGLYGVSLAALAEAEATKGRGALVHAWRFLIKLGSILSVPVMIWGILYAYPLIRVTFGDEYIPAILPFIVYSSFGVLGRMLGGGTNITAMYVVGREKIAFLIRLCCGALNLGLDIILIPIFKAMGAIIATGGAGLILMVAELTLAKVVMKGKFPVLFTVKMTISCLVAAGASLIVPMDWETPWLWQLLLSALVYTAAFFAMLRLLRVIEEEDWELMGRLSPRLQWLVAKGLGYKNTLIK